MPTDSRGLEAPEDVPSGTVKRLLWDAQQKRRAIQTHINAEGYEFPQPHVVAESYDRNEHPWLHGRRPVTLVARAREHWPF